MTIELEIKSADAAEVKGGGVIAVDDDRTFTIIGSVTGIRDEVNDIIEPGAYTDTLKKRTPKIIKDHQWSDRLGKTLHIEEYLPGDSRLPQQTADGQPWPREAGALVAKVRLFGSTAGREAAERWREYGNQQQYSIGYVVPPGKAAKDPKTGVRRIKSLDLFEISDVLWGAMPLAGPMPDAMATKMLPVIEAEAEGQAIEDDVEPVDHDDAETKDLLDEDVTAELPALVAEAVPAEVKAADVSALLSDLLGEQVEVKYDTSPVGKPGGRQNWVDKAGGLPAFIRAIAHALIRHGATEERAIATAVATCKRWAAGTGNVSAKTRAKAAAAVAEWERKKASHGKDLFDGEDVEEKAIRRWDPAKHPRGFHGRFGRGGGGSNHTRADYHLAPDPGKGVPKERQKALADVEHVVYDIEGPVNVRNPEDGGTYVHLDDASDDVLVDLRLTERERNAAATKIASKLTEAGYTHERTTLGFRVKPKTQAKGLMDVVEETFYGWQPELDAKGDLVPLESKGAPRLPGTLEERRDLIATAVKDAFGGDPAMIVGTSEDHVIASRVVVDDEGAPTGVESYRIGYTIRAGLVHLDEPEPVHLTLDTADGEVAPEDVHVADVVEDAVLAAKTLLLPGVIEGKAGRVLSGGNTDRIKNAVQALIAVLKAAGVDLDPQGDDTPGAPPTAPAPTPAPVAPQVKGLDGLPDPHELVASLRAAARTE